MADPGYIVDGVLTDGEAWVGLGTTTLGSDTASITFTSPDDGSSTDWSQFMDLMVIAYVATDRAAVADLMVTRINSDTTAANYAYQYLMGDGSSATAGSATSGSRGVDSRSCSAASSTNIFSAITMAFSDVNSGKYKSVLVQTANDIDAVSWQNNVVLTAVTWKSQAPMTSLTFSPLSGSNLAAGTMISLFGILPRMVA